LKDERAVEEFITFRQIPKNSKIIYKNGKLYIKTQRVAEKL